MLVVDAARGIDQVYRRNIAFAAACRTHSAETADGDGARAYAAVGQRANHDIQRNVVTAHNDKIGRTFGFSDQRDFNLAVGIERGGERIDGKKPVRLRERRHRTRAFSGRECDEALVIAYQRNQYELFAAEL